MTDDNRKKWNRLPKININRKILSRRMRKVEGATTRHAHRFIIKRWENVRDVQRNVMVWIIAMGLLIAATGLQLMWYQQSYQTTSPSRDGVYAEGVLGPVETLNPLYAETSAEQSASYLIFSRLLKYDRTGHLNYDIATNVQINDTKTVYTVTIRPDIKWHDGTRLTASDVAFTVGVMKDSSARTVETGWGGITVKAINDTTIEFTAPATFAAFEHALTFPIVPKHILGRIKPSSLRENNFSQTPVGSGPFQFSYLQNIDTKTGHKVIFLTRNDSYYGGSVNLSRFQLHVYGTNDAIITALSQSEINSAAGVSSTDLGRIDTKRFIISSEPIQSGVYAILNNKSAFLKDLKLRQALRLATDSSATRNELPGRNPALFLPFTTHQLTGDAPKAPIYDQLAAKKLLEDNGWKLNNKKNREKDGKELIISVVTIKNSEFERVLEVLAGQWRALGVVVETQVIDLTDTNQNVYQTILQPRNFDVLLYQLSIGADPDVYVYWHSSQASPQGLNYSNYSNPISDDALTSARARVAPALRNAKYITFAKQWLADVPAIGLYQSTTQYIFSSDTHSFDKSNVLISPIDRYSDVLDWSVGSRTVFKTP